MTEKPFDPKKYIEQSTKLINDLGGYIENNKPSPELIDAVKGLYSDLSKIHNVLEEVEVME
jgi:hypothetical protein